MRLRSTFLPATLFAAIHAVTLWGAEPVPPRGSVAALASPDITVRRAAIDAIQTLDDPAIPAVCLPLLKDEGFSIRRQAARAIGSRFAEIPPVERKTYVAALKVCAAGRPADVTLLCQRAIGLLTANYAFPSFSVSPNGKWVLYERRRLPVIAPTKRGGAHRLLSPVSDDPRGMKGLLKLAITNEPAARLFAPHWHSGGNAVAYTPVLQHRFYYPVCIWTAGDDDVKVLDLRSLKALLPPRYPGWGTTSEFAGWMGDKAVVRVYDCDDPDRNTPPNDPGVFVTYDIRTRKLERIPSPVNLGP